MSRTCTICNSPALAAITDEIMARRPLRLIAACHPGITIWALSRHIRRHLTKTLHKVAIEAGDVTTTMAKELVGLAEPTLARMERLQAETLQIAQTAKEANDHRTQLAAHRELRKGYEFLSRLRGELNPLVPSEEGRNCPLQVTIVYADKAAVQVNDPKRPNGPDPDVS